MRSSSNRHQLARYMPTSRARVWIAPSGVEHGERARIAWRALIEAPRQMRMTRRVLETVPRGVLTLQRNTASLSMMRMRNSPQEGIPSPTSTRKQRFRQLCRSWHAREWLKCQNERLQLCRHAILVEWPRPPQKRRPPQTVSTRSI